MHRGLYFPGVRPDERWVGGLLPFVERLVVYEVGEVPLAPAAQTAWELKVVAPLGDDAKRFLALLREMTGSDGAVIRGQLLAMASRPGRDRDETKAWSLTSAIHHMGEEAAENIAKARAERIWQARLFLKLAEMVTAAEAEINLGLAALAGKQAAMLKALQGEDDGDEPDEILPVSAPSRPLPSRLFRVRDQLAAWAVFHLLDPEPERLLLTDDPEVAALLVDEVEKLAPGRVLDLPELAGDLAENDRAVVAQAWQDLLAGQVEKALATLQELGESHRRSARTAGTVPMSLRLQLLPGPEFRQVLCELSGLPGEDGASASTSPYVLVGATAPGAVHL